jgi:hypothetical protein
MKKLIFIAVIAATLTACGTTRHNTIDDEPAFSGAAQQYTQDFGKVEVTFDDKGNWISIKSSATSNVPVDVDAGLEQGMNVAVMRAKRNIVEFINTDLQSQKTTDTLTKSLAKSVADNDEVSKQRAANIAQEITEKIAVNANGILKGVYVTDRKVSPDHRMVAVTVQVDKNSMRAAKQLRAAFNSSK